MSAAGDIVLAEVPCISCGYNLHMQPADGRCPECGTYVAETLGQALPGGRASILRMANMLTVAAALDIGLVIGCVILVAAEFMNFRELPLLFLFFFFGITTHALLQVAAAVSMTLARPGGTPPWRRRAIRISGVCFVGATLAPLIMAIAIVTRVRSHVPFVGAGAVGTALFPGLGVFAWTLCAHYASDCAARGWRGLAQYSVCVGAFFALGAGFLEFAFLGMMLVDVGPNRYWLSRLNASGALAWSFFGGLFLLVAGTLAATILQFVLARRLTKLAGYFRKHPVLTGPPPASAALSPQ